jgi:hypothetical protein
VNHKVCQTGLSDADVDCDPDSDTDSEGLDSYPSGKKGV